LRSYKKILVIENGIKAKLLENILTEKKIPHVIKSYHDSALDGLIQLSMGWGHLEAPQEYENEILEIYDDLSL
jgi:hypothetical protein